MFFTKYIFTTKKCFLGNRFRQKNSKRKIYIRNIKFTFQKISLSFKICFEKYFRNLCSDIT